MTTAREQPEYKAVKSLARLIEQPLILASSSFFLWQSILYLLGLSSSNAVLGVAGVVSLSGGDSKVSLETITDSAGNKHLKARLTGTFELSVPLRIPSVVVYSSYFGVCLRCQIISEVVGAHEMGVLHL